MSAKLVIQKYLEDFKYVGKTMVDLPYDNLPFLTAKEPVLNTKGERISKSYYAPNGKEAVRQVYKKKIGTFNFNGTDYPDVFFGVTVDIYHLRWDETLHYKGKRDYNFTLQPIFDTVDTTKIVGFSSAKQRQILKSERYASDDYLQSQNPTLYDLLYSNYASFYDAYLRTGIKTNLVNAINAETDQNIIDIFNRNVYGSNPAITIKDLILMNLQG
jgi:hypothetical protein